ncbi:hypothetical protein [Aristophania vespae]|uniref:hypothetical protein n=1 Tax=Aristophania vespae TaxID=2697033 RepID=UPI00235106F4|nr:hypothetical protein [Aristophania vespae]UMM63916.1 hypothetical protein DM15PD_08960 [Aristophania vespae]
MKILFSLRHWLQQPSTLYGLSAFIGGIIGLWFKAITPDIAYTMMAASLPMLLPDNTSAQRIGQAALLPLISALSHHKGSGTNLNAPDKIGHINSKNYFRNPY